MTERPRTNGDAPTDDQPESEPDYEDRRAQAMDALHTADAAVVVTYQADLGNCEMVRMIDTEAMSLAQLVGTTELIKAQLQKQHDALPSPGEIMADSPSTLPEHLAELAPEGMTVVDLRDGDQEPDNQSQDSDPEGMYR